jgi:hypothetical protein
MPKLPAVEDQSFQHLHMKGKPVLKAAVCTAPAGLCVYLKHFPLAVAA